MEISSRAWHLRWVRFFIPEYTPRDVCRYFWALVFHLTLVPLCYIPSWPVPKIISWLDWRLQQRTGRVQPAFVPNGGWRVFFTLVLSVALPVLLILVFEEEWKSKCEPHSKAPKSPSLIKLAWAYLMAKKRGICLLIVVKD